MGRASFRTTVRLLPEGTQRLSHSTRRFRDRQESADSTAALRPPRLGLGIRGQAPGASEAYGKKAGKRPGASVSRWMRRRAPAGSVTGKCTA